MLKRVLLGACVVNFVSPALAIALLAPRPHLPPVIFEVRSLSVPCACRPRAIKRLAVAKPKKTITIITVSVTAREERRRKKRYDIPDIPKRK